MRQPQPATFTADQLVAIFDSVETREDLLAARQACESAQHTLNDAERVRVARSLVAAAGRALTWRTPKCADCGG
jgi:hypothetical protein